MSECIKIKGVQDELEVHETKIVITPKGILGFLNKGMKGSKEIPLSSITAIQFKDGGAITSGYIQFTLMGGNESKGGLFGAVADENTFMFTKKENEEMRKVKIFLDTRIGHQASSAPVAISVADEIAKLSELHISGAISEEEFKEMKSNLIKKAA